MNFSRIYQKFTQSVLLLLLIAGAIGNVYAKQCNDDARFYTLKTVINQMKAGQEVAPIKVTRSTFLHLTPNIRQALGDNIRILDANCIPVEVVNGEPAKKLLVDFEDLTPVMHQLALKNDLEGLTGLMTHFQAAPKTTSQLISLLQPLNWSAKATTFARENGLLNVLGRAADSSSDAIHCGKTVADNTYVELYQKLGGRVSDATLVSYRGSEDSGLAVLSANDAYFRDFTDIRIKISNDTTARCVSMHYKAALAALSGAGVQLVKNANTGSGSRAGFANMQKWLKATFPDQYENDSEL